MFTRPTSEQILLAVAEEVRDTVLPEVASEPVRVLLGQVEQILRSLAVRAAHEIAWIHDEVAAIEEATGEDLGRPSSLHLDDVVAWYDASSRALSRAIDAAFAAGDRDRVAQLKALLDDRSANEMRIVGALDLVGRG